MANPIRRIIQLVLDKASAAKAEADAKRALGGIETGIGRLKSAALAFGAAIAGALSVVALVRFGKEAVRAADEAEQVWNDLRGTIKAAGGDFEALEERINGAASAMQDATRFEGEDYAAGLTRMISLTGNVEGSIRNMGLAANVAAQFFKGDLGAGIELVAKVSQGVVTPLGKMGIHVKGAAEGLEVLANRSAGAAARQLESLGGILRVVSNTWGDFKEAIGDALIAGAEGTSIFETMIAVIKVLTAWVVENKDAIRGWVVDGFRNLVLALDAVYRGIRGTGEIITGVFVAALGGLTYATTTAALAFVALFDAVNAIPKFLGTKAARALGFDAIADGLENVTTGIKRNLRELRAWGAEAAKVGAASVGQGASRLANRGGLASGLLSARGGGRPGFDAGSPVVIPGSGEEGEGGKAEKAKVETDAVTASFLKLAEAMQLSQGMHQLLGKEYDLNAAKASYLTAHLQELLTAGLSPMDPYLIGIAAELETLRVKEDRLAEATIAFNREMATIETQAEAIGSGFDSLGAQASALEGMIRTLAEMGFQASDPIMQHYIEQLGHVGEAMGLSKSQAEDYATAVSNTQAIIVGALGGSLAEVAKAKAKENLLLAAEQTAHGIVSLLNPFTAAKAAGHFQSAATFGAIAAGWGALGAAIGGGGGGKGGSSLGGARGASGAAAEGRQEPKQEVHIYMTGQLSAMDPKLQKAVWGATKYAEQRFGKNAQVTVSVREGE